MVAQLQNGLYVREDLWSLERWDPTLLWYARAVRAMFPKDIADSSSWRFQAAIHGYDDTLPELIKLKKVGEKLPSQATQNMYWMQCQHACWYFLPWHRGYLGYFERIVRKTIVGLGGPKEWALPFWNYNGRDGQSRYMRPEFLEPTLPDGSPNGLFVGVQRGPHKPVNTPLGVAGDFSIGINDVSLKWLSLDKFTDAPTAASFGGGMTGFHHGEGNDPDPDVLGQLEKTPHGNVHNDVGEWMSSFETAGLDPIFWLHHSNIDRLWQVWLSHDPARLNPAANDWLVPRGLNLPFLFYDENGSSQSCDPKDVLYTDTSKFTYKYANLDVSAPAPAVKLTGLLGFQLRQPSKPADDFPKMVAASAVNIALGAPHTLAELPIQHPVEAMMALKDQAPANAYLNIENVTGTGRLSTEYVYVNVPPGDKPQDHQDLYAGSIPMFGVAEASRKSAEHGGSGRTFVLDISDLVASLKSSGRWNPKKLTVSFIPKQPLPEGASVMVGRISLFYR